MPCPEHKALSAETVKAMIAHDRYRDSVTAHLSAKARAEGLSSAASILRNKQSIEDAHLLSCDVCKAEGRRPSLDLTDPQHF